MRRKLIAAVLFCVLVSITPTSFAAIIRDITGSLLESDLYHGSGDYFQLNYSGTEWPTNIENMLLSTETGDLYWIDNMLTGGTFDIGASSLVADLSSGGLARGTFASGATLTISGDLYADDWYTVVASGDLITAVISTQFTMEELPYPARADTLSGRIIFHITGGALSNASLNDAGLILGDFYLDFLFNATTPSVTDFGISGNYNCLRPTFQGATSVPEPASLILMGLGGMALIRKRK